MLEIYEPNLHRATRAEEKDEEEHEKLVQKAREMFPAETRSLPSFPRSWTILNECEPQIREQDLEDIRQTVCRKHGEKILSQIRKRQPLEAAAFQDLVQSLDAKIGNRGSKLAAWNATRPSSLRLLLGDRKWKALVASLEGGARAAFTHSESNSRAMIGMRLSRLRADVCKEGHKRMKSAAKGDNFYSFFRSSVRYSKGLVGRCQVDMMQMVKDRDQPSSNALKHAAEVYLKEDASMRKQEMDYHEMFDLYRSGDPAQQWKILEYCWYDSAVCIWVAAARGYWTTVLQEARVTQTRIDDIFNGGQQTKVYSALAHICSGGDVLKSMRAQPQHAQPLPECGFAINSWARTEWPAPEPEEGDDPEPRPARFADEDEDAFRPPPDYKGAVVLDPKPAFYQDPVVSLDFASLYPSIIRSDNLCYSTIFLQEQDALRLALRRDVVVVNAADTSTQEMNRLLAAYRVVISRYTITHTIGGREFDRHYYVDQSRVGVLPRILNHLHAWRKDEKRLKKEAKSKDVKELHDKRQLGIKLVMNSLYGFLGVSQQKGMLPCKPLAAIVTCVGRGMIDATKNGAESLCEGAFVVYGDTDSVMVRLPRDRFPTLGAVWAEGERLAGIISKVFRPPHDLEMEEIKWPFLLTDKKKTYAARAWEPARGGGYAPHVLIKGLDPVRKDRVKVSRDLVTSVLNSLLGSGTDVEQGDAVPSVVGTDGEDRAALQVAEVLDDMIGERKPLEDYVLSRTTRLNYKNKEANVAPMVRERMLKRGDADVPPIGARVPYVLTTRGGPAAKQAVAADSPFWFAQNVRKEGLRLRYQYYIGLLKNPLQKILQYTSIPVQRLLDAAANSLHAAKGACVVGIRSDTPVQDLVRRIAEQKRVAKRCKTRKKSGAARVPKRRVVVGKRRR